MQWHSITLDTTGTTYACRRPRYIARGKKKRNTKKEKEKREKKQCCELILICCYCCGDDVGSLAGNSTRASLRVIYPNHWTVEEVIVCIKLPGLYRLVQIERQKLCPREFLTPFFRVRPRNFAHIFWKAVSKTQRGGFFNLGFRCRDIRVLTPPRVKHSSRDPE